MIFDKRQVYYLVYSSENEGNAKRAAEILSQRCGLHVEAVSDDNSYENEILFGRVARELIDNLSLNLVLPDSYLFGVYGDSYVILSDDRFGIALGFYDLIKKLEAAEGDKTVLGAGSNVSGRIKNLICNDDYLGAVKLGRAIFETHASWIKKAIQKMSENDKGDIELIEKLICRLGNGAVFCAGSSSVLWNGSIVKTDRKDYANVTDINAEGHVIIATDFAMRYFGIAPTTEKSFDLNAFVDTRDDFSLSVYKDIGLAVLLPMGTEVFLRCGADSVYLERMAEFFNNPILPEPETEVEQTRQEILYTQFGTEYNFDYTEVTYDNYYSPAILITKLQDGSPVWYVAHEISKLKNHKEVSTSTHLQMSTDLGKSWSTVAIVASMRWAGLYEINGKIYLMGNHTYNRECMVAEWIPESGALRVATLGFDVMGSAPCALAVYNGRIYRAYHGSVISAPIDADFLDGNAWTRSNSPQKLISRETYEKVTGTLTDAKRTFWFEEGSVIEGKDGKLYVMYRIDATPTWGYAAIFSLTDDGTTVSLIESCNSLVPFPSNQSKFMIKRDKKTGLYLTLVSLPTGSYTHQRNVLGLAVSDDLMHWRTASTLLVDRQMMNNQLSFWSHAFQYVDFDFNGDDIVLIVRESTGDTCSYHDGTCLTLYTIKDYEKLLK